MSASLSSVTTMGYGLGTYEGTMSLVVTMGFAIGDESIISPWYHYYRTLLSNYNPV